MVKQCRGYSFLIYTKARSTLLLSYYIMNAIIMVKEDCIVARPNIINNRVLVGLLYINSPHIERDCPKYIVGVTGFCRLLNITPRQFKDALESLVEEEKIINLNWQRYWVSFILVPPIGL